MNSQPKTLLLPVVIRWTSFLLLSAGIIGLVLTIRGDFKNFRNQLSHLPLLHSLMIERDQIVAQEKLATLNYSIPSFDYLVKFIEQPGVFDQNRLRFGYNSYIGYYEQVVGLFPDMAEGYGILGFLYFQEGDLPKALGAYQKAAKLNPYFFWFHYNLGVLYGKSSEYALAASEFKRALTLAPEISLKIIMNSKIYQQILSQEDFHYNLQDSLRKAYQDCYAMMQISSQSTKTDFPKTSNATFEKFPLKIF